VSNVKVEIVENPVTISTNDDNVVVSTTDQVVTISLGTSGPQGPKGDPGEVQYVDLSYVHDQSSAAAVWTINHGLQFIPSITVVDSSGNVVEGSYNYPDENTVIVTFSSAFAGKAYLS
jgi:hypothetical protein